MGRSSIIEYRKCTWVSRVSRAFSDEEAVFIGSTPSHVPFQTQAVSTQTLGYIGSMPHGGPKKLHASAGWVAEQPAFGSGLSSTLDEDIKRFGG